MTYEDGLEAMEELGLDLHPLRYAPTLLLEPPAPDEGEIRHVVEDYTAAACAPKDMTNPCVHCGAEIPAHEPHVMVRARIVVDFGTVSSKNRQGYLCDRECWLEWATK